MRKPKLYNRPNECIKSTDGREFWISRSVAVMCVVLISQGDTTHVLLNKRGKGTPDYQGYWCCPCGYLDWNESAYEAVTREVWEESGINLEILNDKFESLYFSTDPWSVNSDPERRRRNYRQNVTLRFGAWFQLPQGQDLPKLTSRHSEKEEIADLAWINLLLPLTKCAFGHDRLIKEFVVFARK